MRASKLFGAAAMTVVLLSASGAFAKEELKSQNPWRDTAIDYGHSFSAISLNKNAEPTYNPYYAHSLTITPVWHLWDDYLVAKVRLAMEQELTNSDDTTYKNEVVFNDMQIDLGTAGVTEGITGIKNRRRRALLPAHFEGGRGDDDVAGLRSVPFGLSQVPAPRGPHHRLLRSLQLCLLPLHHHAEQQPVDTLRW
ncbi:MAG: hypothetical protein QM765_22005 [Myxococcales bacterium]